MDPFLRPALMSNLMDPRPLIDEARWLWNVCTIGNLTRCWPSEVSWGRQGELDDGKPARGEKCL